MAKMKMKTMMEMVAVVEEEEVVEEVMEVGVMNRLLIQSFQHQLQRQLQETKKKKKKKKFRRRRHHGQHRA
jgi:hypothetical protein